MGRTKKRAGAGVGPEVGQDPEQDRSRADAGQEQGRSNNRAGAVQEQRLGSSGLGQGRGRSRVGAEQDQGKSSSRAGATTQQRNNGFTSVLQLQLNRILPRRHKRGLSKKN